MSAGYMRKCARKERHPTRELAEQCRRRMVAAGKWRLSSSNTYWCNQCGSWHAGRLGGRPRGKGRR